MKYEDVNDSDTRFVWLLNWRGEGPCLSNRGNLSRPVLLETETAKASFEQASAASIYADVSKYFVVLELYLEEVN